jgi:methyl-accepting chemotaxis protein
VKILPTKKVCITLGLVFGCLVVLAFLNRRTSVQLQETSASVSHSQQVRATLARLLAAVQDVQMGQRGYVLTGDKKFLTPYTFGVQQTQVQFDRLVHLTLDNPRQQARLTELKPLLDQKLAHSRNTIALRDAVGFEAAQREVASGKGQSMTDSVRLALQEMDHVEAAALAKSSQSVRNAAASNVFAFLAFSVVGLGFLAAVCFFFVRASHRQRAMESESRTKTIMLHSVLQGISDGVAVTDASGNFLVFNWAAEQVLGIGKAEGGESQKEGNPNGSCLTNARPFLRMNCRCRARFAASL